ncbi:MAG: EAL domain-containing protein [Betaproteobacteria bacterium]|nr:EAL domain-containing protein [Betaproteobacteria bacterium]MBU6512370.1 EAL domain-containing protein [Betaproteobacteria bacterium]MDE1954358.1 EAL domain-containing protein [Betaproteobacteria bacterium]MDE2152339.1 EAL domain-containing protein [Betaproteobacteria bacterium]
MNSPQHQHRPPAWLAAPQPEREAERLQALERLGVLDTPPEPLFDQLAACAARVLEAPVAAVSLIDSRRQWFKALAGSQAAGWPRETPREVSLCGHAIAGEGLFEVPDASADPRFAANPLVTGEPGLRFYAGVPLRGSEGLPVGTLCILDFRPRRLSPSQREMLQALAEQAGHALEARLAARQLELARRQLQRAADFNAMLAQASQAIAEAGEQGALLQSICDIAVRRGGLALAYVARPGADGYFEFPARAGADAHLAQLRLRVEPRNDEELSPAAWVWHNARAHYTSWEPDQDVLRSWQSRSHRHGLKSNATVPILRSGRVWGVLAALHAEADAFDAELQQLMVELAANIARGLDRLDTQHRERELAGIQRTLLDNTLAGIVMVRDRMVLSANQRFAQMLGYDGPASVEGQPGRRFFADDAEYERVGRLYAQAGIQRPISVMDVRLLRSDGQEVLCDGSLGLPADGDGTMFVWTVQDVTERSRLQRRLRYEALHDPLSALPNRRALEQHLPGALERARRRQAGLAVGILDLDDFKPVNDLYGHEAGDLLLREFAARMRGLLRESDFLARLGGDEFVVVIEDLSEAALLRELDAVMRRLHTAVERGFTLASGAQAGVGMTMGLAAYPADGGDADSLLRKADAALYQAKARKADRVRWWQLGARSAGDETQELRADPYGPRACALLGELAGPLAQAVDGFLQDFYAQVVRDDAAAPMVELLSGQELDAIRDVHARHLRQLLDPARAREELAQRSERVGVKQALMGIEPSLLVRPMAAFRQHVVEGLGAGRIPAATRREILRVIEDRLQEDLQHELRGMSATVRAWQNVLIGHTVPAGALWRDALRDLIGPIGALPGVVACEVLRPNASNEFAVEAASGPCADEVSAILADARFTARLDPGEATGRGPIALAWRGAAVQRIASYARDERVAQWRTPMLALGVRSAVTLAVLDTQGKPSFVLSIYGAYPHQFESAWMQQTVKALQQHAGRVWQASRVPLPGGIIPQDAANACRESLFSNGLRMYVQPVVNLLDGRCDKVEALARLMMPDGRVLAPGAFLPILGDAELDHLFRSGLEQVCAQLRAWDGEGMRMGAALNLAPSTLLDPQCPQWVRETLQRHGIEASRLSLELLESQALDSAAQTRAIDALRAIGVGLSMDDLGAGYSSLQRLSVLPFDTIKIDQGLISSLRSLPLQTFGVIRSIVQLSNDLRRTVIVEGVEDQGIQEVVRILGARWAQGYAFTRPMPAGSFARWRAEFTLPRRGQAVSTYLGALAHHWLLAPGRRHPARRGARAAMLEFLRQTGEHSSEIYRYYEQAVPAQARARHALHERHGEWLLERLGSGA